MTVSAQKEGIECPKCLGFLCHSESCPDGDPAFRSSVRANPTQALSRAIHLLAEEAEQLDRWAEESRVGGWSTHQADPMRRRAAHLREQVAALMLQGGTR